MENLAAISSLVVDGPPPSPLSPSPVDYGGMDRDTLLTLAAFRPRVVFSLEKKSYGLKTAETAAEVEAAFRLRHQVFEREWRGGAADEGWESDLFDRRADHLIILEQKTGEVVGTYRLIASRFSDRFYSETEFVLDAFLATPGDKLELGRACVRADHRNGMTLALLWTGIMRYAREVNARTLFGCSSVNTSDPEKVALLCRHFAGIGAVAPIPIPPRLRNRCHDLADLPLSGGASDQERTRDEEEARGLVPPLLHSYIKAGALVSRRPAVDDHFGCVDFLTILDLQRINPTFGKKLVK